MFHEAVKVTGANEQKVLAKRERRSVWLRDEELVPLAQEGDQWATEELVRRYRQKAYAIAYHMCFGDSEEAEDLTQEAFLRALRSIKRFGRRSSFYTWFYRILVNTCIDGVRRRRRREGIFSFWSKEKNGKGASRVVVEKQPDEEDGPNPMAVLSYKELRREARKALESLSEKQRVAFQLKVLHGMSIPEVAQVMGSAEGTVKSHLFRATRLLREALKDWAAP